jgi:hypothetical protein
MKVECAHDEMMSVEQLLSRRNPKNPNTHSASQVAAIAGVMEANGIRQAIVLSRRSGKIIKGHGRLEAAVLLGYDQFPIDWQEYESGQAELADMVADNRLSELSEIDAEMLGDVLKELQAAGHDIASAGFTEDELAALTKQESESEQLEMIPNMEIQPFEHYDYLVFMFADIRDWLRVLQKLKVQPRVNFSISRKTKKIGIGRVINGKTLLRRLDDPPCDNVAGQSGQADNTPAR